MNKFNITIIVLLILAGVSISLVVGDNGVLTQASSASEKTDVAKAKEAVEQAISSIQGKFTEVWAQDNSKAFINFLGTTTTVNGKTIDGTFANNMGGTTYDISYTAVDATTPVNAEAVSTAGSIKVNNVYYWFKVKGTSNGLGAKIEWNDTTTTTDSAPTSGWTLN